MFDHLCGTGGLYPYARPALVCHEALEGPQMRVEPLVCSHSPCHDITWAVDCTYTTCCWDREHMNVKVTTTDKALAQIDAVMGLPSAFTYRQGPRGNYPDPEQHAAFFTAALSCTQRLAGRDSVYFERINIAVERSGPTPNFAVEGVVGILSSLRADINAGHLDSVAQEVKRAVASDFLSLAESFIDEDRDNKPLVTAAAVLAGGVLEEHIRRLCEKHGIDTERANNKGDMVRKNVSRLNGELRSAQAYEQIDHDNVLSWYRIRTHAAHAEYERYDAGRVEYMITGLRRFISDYPA